MAVGKLMKVPLSTYQPYGLRAIRVSVNLAKRAHYQDVRVDGTMQLQELKWIIAVVACLAGLALNSYLGRRLARPLLDAMRIPCQPNSA